MTEETLQDATGEAAPGAPLRFRDFNLAPDVLEALTRMGIDTPTPIQAACIPSILEGKDVIGKAETGTGKTIGFGAPLVGKIDTQRVAVQALVLAPTRELAQQVAGVLEQLGSGRGLGVALVVGGVHASEQVLKLRSGSQVVVGTPGRVLDFLRGGTLSLVWCETAVLDEADRMLDMGFIDDVSAILDKTPPERQTLLFSATIPPEIQRLLKRYMRDPAQFSTSKGLSTVADIRQVCVEAEFGAKFGILQRILNTRVGSTVIIFCNTRRQAIDLDRMLWGHGYSAGALHGDQEQDVRFKILEAFRRGDIKILVATDVASRGLDIEDVACVVNYEIPDEAESYVHRIGRTGRAQRSGEAISIVARKEMSSWRKILGQTKFQVEWINAGPTSRRGGSNGAPDRGSQGRRSDRPRAQERSHPREDGPPSRRESTAGVPVQGDDEPEFYQDDQYHTGDSSVAGDNENPGFTQSSGEGAPPARPHRPQPPQAAGEREAPPRAEGPGGEGGADRRRSRRRRRRGGDRGPDRFEPVPAPNPQTRRGEGKGGSPTEARMAPPPPPASYPGSDEVPSAEEVQTWLKSRPKPAAPKQVRMPLEDLDDDYLKTEYFEVDHDLVERAGPPPRLSTPQRTATGAPPRPEGQGGGGERRGAGAGGSGGRRRDRRGRRRPDAGGPSGGQLARAAGGEPARSNAGGAPQGDGDQGARRRRRRRRGRGRGPGGQGGGAPQG